MSISLDELADALHDSQEVLRQSLPMTQDEASRSTGQRGAARRLGDGGA